MTSKLFEVRDSNTYIPVLAVRLDSESEAERYMLGRSGYGITFEEQARYVLFMRIAGGTDEYSCDPYTWSDRTMTTAHKYAVEHFDELKSGDVIDVEFILGETTKPKPSDRFSGL